jgi:NADH-quinone oxidoreductase subunit J
MTAEAFFLYFFGLLAIAGAVGMLAQRSPIQASLSLAVTFLSLGAMFAALDAHFLAIIQLIVYAGLIQVLIIYTIMLMDLNEEDLKRRISFARILGGAAGVLLLVQVFFAVLRTVSPDEPAAAGEGFGTTAAVAHTLYGKFLLPFEIVSVLLLAGIVGAVLLAKQTTMKRGKSELSKNPTPIDTESSVNPKLIKR